MRNSRWISSSGFLSDLSVLDSIIHDTRDGTLGLSYDGVGTTRSGAGKGRMSSDIQSAQQLPWGKHLPKLPLATRHKVAKAREQMKFILWYIILKTVAVWLRRLSQK